MSDSHTAWYVYTGLTATEPGMFTQVWQRPSLVHLFRSEWHHSLVHLYRYDRNSLVCLYRSDSQSLLRWHRSNTLLYRGFPTRMVYLYYIWCLRYTIPAGNPRYLPGMGIKNGKVSWKVGVWEPQKAPSGGQGDGSPLKLKLFNKNKT